VRDRGPLSVVQDAAMGRLAVLAALGVALALPAAHAATPCTQLQRYLASMSWPLRASLPRAQSVSVAIDCAVSLGDPPCWREVAGRCVNLRAVEERGHLLRVAPPSSLASSHSVLARAYSALREGCVEARKKALAVAAAPSEHETADGRAALRAFARTRIDPFTAAVRSWRAAALRRAATAGARAAWLTALAP
jgi:hypothetical protein